MRTHNIHTVRDGLRWHLIEQSGDRYDWSSFLPQLYAARHTGVQVVWDICHYGWPDDIDIWSPEFVDRFARFAGAAAAIVRDECPGTAFYCPVNEISFLSWVGAEAGGYNPFVYGRGTELKCQLVRATIAAIQAIHEVDPYARIVSVDPVINVVPTPLCQEHEAEEMRLAQYEAWDMIAGLLLPELGGKPHFLDVMGINFYPHNQWYLGGQTIRPGEPHYRPLREILAETYDRYRRPLFIAETGAEGDHRVSWLRYVCDEVLAALQNNIPVEGICLYPVIDYPGWDDDRHCPSGLLGLADMHGYRRVHDALAAEVVLQQKRFQEVFAESETRSWASNHSNS